MEQIYRNCKALCKFNRIKIGDLEQQAGLSVGYLSKTSTRKKGISIEKTAKIAEILEVSIDDLIKKDYEKELEISLATMDFMDAYKNLRRFLSKDFIIDMAKDMG